VLCVLGPPALAGPNGLEPLVLRPKALALLVRLALTSESQQRSLLAELLFPEAAKPRDSLRWHLSYLRTRLPNTITVERDAVSSVTPTDVQLFRRGVAAILGNSPTPDAVETLALYRGDLCSGLRVAASVDFHNWLYVEEDELRRLFRRATLTFARQALHDDRAGAAIPPLRRLTSVDPYFEDGHVLLVESLEATGDRASARHSYDRYQRILRTELQVEPRAELTLRYEAHQPHGRGLPLDELVPLRQITMHAIEWPGSEPAILAIHGSAGHGYRFTSWGEALSPDLRVIAVDLRGHGYSDKPPDGYAVDDHVHDLLQFITSLALPRPILLGHSLGGSIATFVAAAAGDLIGGLILLDAVVGDHAFVESASFVLHEWGHTLDQRFVSFEAYQAFWANEIDDTQWQRWLAINDHMELAALPDGTLRQRALRQALAAEWASVAHNDALDALSRVTAPVLVVHADAPWFHTPYIDSATIQTQLEATAQSRLFVAHGQNHAAVLRKPSESLVAAVRRFAHEVRATANRRAS
jgi:pimeloyl-ACP methyl ester carboxylesterase